MKKKSSKKKSSKKKPQKKTQTDPWKAYSASLEKWRTAYESWQKAGNEAFEKYNVALKSGINPSKNYLDGMKEFNENWQKIWDK